MLARIKTAIGDRTNRPSWRNGGQEELDDRQDEQELDGEELAKDTTSSDTASLASTASHAPSDMPELKPTSSHAVESVGVDSASSRRSSQGSDIEQQDDPYASAWHFQQCFGDKGDVEDITEADIISTVEFDQTGNYLATGDKGGRVVLFERNETKKTCEYKFHTEFQSHEPEFDYLKSL
ncbi:hypothetical protein KC318_g20741, partial [Hortaea werneckii]